MKMFLLSMLMVALCGCVGMGLLESNLQGEWTGISAVVDGKPLPDTTTHLLRLTITKDRFKTTKGGETLFDSTYHLGLAANPPRIHMLGNEGDLAGKEASGIFELKGDTLTLCYAMPGDPAPTDFKSAPGSKAFLVTWRRASK